MRSATTASHRRTRSSAISTRREADLAALEKLGISLDAVTTKLVADGVRQFADAFDELLGAVARRRRTLFEGDHASLSIRPNDDALAGAIAEEMEAWRKDGRIRRLWAGDASLWTGHDEAQWTGWLHVVEQQLQDVAALQSFAAEVKAKGFTDVVLLGMGGSSLGPEVLAQTFRSAAGLPALSHARQHRSGADPHARRRDRSCATTLFIVQSKSGSTLEPNIFMAHFLDARREERRREADAAEHFVAVTDAGSALEREARQRGFRACVPRRASRSAAATRCCPISAWCRPRRSASTCASSWTRRQHHGARLRPRRAAGGEPGRAARRRARRRGEASGATR